MLLDSSQAAPFRIQIPPPSFVPELCCRAPPETAVREAEDVLQIPPPCDAWFPVTSPPVMVKAPWLKMPPPLEAVLSFMHPLSMRNSFLFVIPPPSLPRLEDTVPFFMVYFPSFKIPVFLLLRTLPEQNSNSPKLYIPQ